jgi:hypothetical protein
MRLMATVPASQHSDLRSAPTKPGVARATTRAGNRHCWLLRGLGAHTKAP